MFLEFIVLWVLLQIAASTIDCDNTNKPQFCVKNSIWDLDACVTISDRAATQGDVHFVISTSFQSGRGWLAFGPGTLMSNALMFVFFPSSDAQNLTVSVRSTRGHNSPLLDGHHHLLEVLRNGQTPRGFYEAEVICHGCLQAPNKEQQHWIWSYNHIQTVRSDDKESPIYLHTTYGGFSVDNQLYLQSEPAGKQLCITQDRITTLSGPSQPSITRTAHGIIMVVTFLFAFPVGVLLLRQPYFGVRVHAIAQVISVLLCELGAILAITTMSQSPITGHLLIHVGIGVTLTVIVPLQALIGWQHHISFIHNGKGTRGCLLRSHRYLGRVIICLGILNVALGATLLKSTYRPTLLLIILGLWSGILLSLHLWLRRGQGNGLNGDETRGHGNYDLLPARNFPTHVPTIH